MATFGETKELVLDYLGDTRLQKPLTPPTILGVAAGGPGWSLKIWKFAVHYIYEEGVSNRGPQATYDLSGGPVNEKASLTAFHSDTLPEGVLGYLLVMTKGDKTTFFKIKREMDTEATTFGFDATEPDNDLIQSVIEHKNKVKDSELSREINYYNKQVQSKTHVIRKNIEAIVQASGSFSIVFSAAGNLITLPSGLDWVDREFFLGLQFEVTNAGVADNNTIFTITNLSGLVATVAETVSNDGGDTTATITQGLFFALDQEGYTLPTDVLVMNEETELFHDGRVVPQISMSELKRRRRDVRAADSPSLGRPQWWFQDADRTKIKFFPIPDSTLVGDKLSFEYVKKLSDMILDSEELLEGRFEEFHNVVAYGATAELFRKRKNFGEASQYQQLYDEGVDQSREATIRDEVTPPLFAQNLCGRRRSQRTSGRYAGPEWDRI